MAKPTGYMKKRFLIMKVGDLVKNINPWTKHNPWMKFNDDSSVGLIMGVSPSGGFLVLWTGKLRPTFHFPESLGAFNEDR